LPKKKYKTISVIPTSNRMAKLKDLHHNLPDMLQKDLKEIEKLNFNWRTDDEIEKKRQVLI
jgi:hypothetical protein